MNATRQEPTFVATDAYGCDPCEATRAEILRDNEAAGCEPPEGFLDFIRTANVGDVMAFGGGAEPRITVERTA